MLPQCDHVNTHTAKTKQKNKIKTENLRENVLKTSKMMSLYSNINAHDKISWNKMWNDLLWIFQETEYFLLNIISFSLVGTKSFERQIVCGMS